MRMAIVLPVVTVTAVAGLAGGRLVAQAADAAPRPGSFLVSSSPALNNITDLWVLDQNTRTVYFCRANAGINNAPTCTKGTPLP